MISPGDAKRLLTWYASESRTGVRGTLSLGGGEGGSSCLLTLAVIIARTPSAYRVPHPDRSGTISILELWCLAYGHESAVIDEHAAARKLYRSKAGTHAAQLAAVRLEYLEPELQHARDQVERIERGQAGAGFEDALDWMALTLEQKLARVSESERWAWEQRLGYSLERLGQAADAVGG